MQYSLRFAAAVLVAAGVALYFTGILPPPSPLAFAEVAAKLRDAHTLTYEVTSKVPKEKELSKGKIFYKDPGWVRSEGAGQITIAEMTQGKILLLDSATKTARLIDNKRTDDTKKKDVTAGIDHLRKLAEKEGESVGKKRIGDLEAEGFRVVEEGFPITVWADPKTKTPVLIEMRITIEDREVLTAMSDFQFDPKLDDALFSLEPPEGYKLRKVEVKEEKPEDDIVSMLRAYTDRFEGKFPKGLSVASTEWQTYLKQRWGDKKKGLPEPAFVQFVQQATRVEVLLRSKKEHGYKPDGVKLGDREKIVFWYRPEKAEKYRAVYGDLHVADVTADQLPEKPKK